MSYTPTNWQTGDTITAEKLNNMESGIVSGQPYIVTFTENDGVFSADKTYTDIYSAVLADGQEVRAVWDGAVVPLTVMSSAKASFNGIVGRPAHQVYFSLGNDGTVYGEVRPLSNEPFIVTLTPTAQDFSGTMDKTVAEINAAYAAGQKIVFRVLTSATTYVDVPMSFAGRNTTLQYPNFGAEIIQVASNLMIVAYTGDTDDGTDNDYSTTIYPLTPMS